MSECGLTNLATCLPEMFFQFIVSMLNSPVQPFLTIVQTLLTEPVNINIFHSLWAVIIYVISLFYGLFFMFAGFNLMISGYDSAKRERAKGWLRNVVLMVLFIQASFLIYDLVIELSSLLTTGMLNIIDPNFFLMTLDNIANVGLQIALLLPYISSLVLTAVLLGLRYVLVAVGVVLFPIAIFFYFIPPLESYGKLILNVLLVIMFLPFFSAIILFGASALLGISVFANFKILLMIIAFMLVDSVMVSLVAFVVLKAAFSVIGKVKSAESSYRYVKKLRDKGFG